MLLQSLRALCLAPGGSGSVRKYLKALVRSPGVSGRMACGFRIELHFADELHAKSPSTCTCEACIMGKMFRKPFQPLCSEDKAKTQLLELIYSDVIWTMQTQMLCGYQYIIMFTDGHWRYTEVYFMKAKSEAPAKFKEYVAKVEKQHPKSKVCQITVDGGGEYASREKFFEYLAEEGSIREVSAPYSQQQNGISERCNRTVVDPAQSTLKHAGMPNKLLAEAESIAVYIKNRLPS